MADDAVADILPWLAPEVAAVLARLPRRWRQSVAEVRLRAGRPLQVVTAGGDFFLGPGGEVAAGPEEAYRIDPSALDRTWQIVCQASVYS
ncbi:MAG TPA: hypothetical protein VIL95_04045, partial [Bacillota bacterium]